MDDKEFYKKGKPIDVFAFYGPCDGKYDDGSPMGDGTDFRTKERYIEYKNCGFDILLMEDEAVYNGEPFETSKVKEIMDICFEIGLKVIVLDRRIYYLAVKGFWGREIDGFTVNSVQDLHALVAFYMKDYSKHPAFYGVYIMDEPSADILDRASTVVGAIKAVDKKFYVHICHTIQGATYSLNDEFIKRDNWSDLTWDDYLFLFYEKPSHPVLARGFHLYMEKIKRLTQKHGIGFTAVTLQAFGGETYNGVSGIGWRAVDDYDLRYQVYASLLYYPNKLVWFHYWASRHNVKRLKEKTIINEFGEKVMYDQVKALNAEIKALSSVMSNFDFNGVNIFRDKKENSYYFLNEITFVLRDMKVEKVKGAVIISEGVDKSNNRTGYLIHNSTDPVKRKKSTVHLSFGNCKEIIVYVKGVPQKISLVNGKFVLKLPCADGVFIIPCN